MICPYCNNTTGDTPYVKKDVFLHFDYVFEEDIYFYKCDVCDLIFAAPITDDYREKLQDHYRNDYNVDRHEDVLSYQRAVWRRTVGLEGRMRRLAHKIRKVSNSCFNNPWPRQPGRVSDFQDLVDRLKPGTLLDVGCSFGDMVAAAWVAGVDAYGVEPTQSVADGCDSFHPGRVFGGDFPEVTGPLPRYDMLLFSHVLVYIPGPSRAFMQAARDLIAPGGSLVVLSYNGEDILKDPYNVGLDSALSLNYMTEDYFRYVKDDLGFASYERVPARYSPLEGFNILTTPKE